MGDTRLDFLSKEIISGELLSERLARLPLSPDDVIRYALEIGGTLHKIHSRGLVHGSLCPASIVLTQDGARILEPGSRIEDRIAYRAPELIRGDEPDVRSDVFAYGAVVYEMVTGHAAFSGVGAELSQNILGRTPAPLPDGSSAPLREVIFGCLEKDPAHRRQRVQNAVIELKLAARALRAAQGVRPPTAAASLTPAPALVPPPASASEAKLPPAAPPDIRTAFPELTAPAWSAYEPQGISIFGFTLRPRIWAIAGVMLALAATAIGAVLFLRPRPATLVLKGSLGQPENSFPGMPTISPDGRYLTFSAMGPEGRRMLWLRPLDSLRATALQGSEDASAPFWSPDSRSIAFFSSKFLKRVKISGGPPEGICPSETVTGGGTWSRDGVILFAPSLADGFYRVPAEGGKPVLLQRLDESKGERANLWPQFLPDGKHFVFYQQTDLPESSGVYLGSLDQPEYRRLFTSQTNAVFSAAADPSKPGYLLYINDRNLMAQPFDPVRGEVVQQPVILANQIGAVRSMALAPLSVSANGALVYQGVGQPTRQMVWMDRAGRQVAAAGSPGDWGPPRISPDGNQAVVARTSPDGIAAHLWLLDPRGNARQFTDGAMHEGSPVWSPDGMRVAYFGRQGENYDIFWRAMQPDAKGELLLKSPEKKFPSDWSRDGKHITYTVDAKNTRLDVWGFSTGDRRTAPLLDTAYSEGFGAVSPNGKWLAYQSDQSGRDEVYIQSFDGLTSGAKRRWMVSKGGGLPRWRSDSNELFYITTDGRIMAVSIHAGIEGGIDAAPPQVLFQTRPIPNSWNQFDVTSDGQRFLVNVPFEWTSSAPVTVVPNWNSR